MLIVLQKDTTEVLQGLCFWLEGGKGTISPPAGQLQCALNLKTSEWLGSIIHNLFGNNSSRLYWEQMKRSKIRQCSSFPQTHQFLHSPPHPPISSLPFCPTWSPFPPCPHIPIALMSRQILEQIKADESFNTRRFDLKIFISCGIKTSCIEWFLCCDLLQYLPAHQL